MSELTKNGFVMIPNQLVRTNALSPSQLQLFLIIKSFNPSFASYEWMRKNTGFASSTVSRNLKVLTKKKFIKYKKGNSFGNANNYTVLPESQWDLTPRRKYSKNEVKTNSKMKGEELSKLESKKNKIKKTKNNISENNSESRNTVRAKRLIKYYRSEYKRRKPSSKYILKDERKVISEIVECLISGVTYKDLKQALRNVFIHDELKKYSNNISIVLKDNVLSQLLAAENMPVESAYDRRCLKKKKIIIGNHSIDTNLEDNKYFKERFEKAKKSISSLYETLYLAECSLIHNYRGRFGNSIPRDVYSRLVELDEMGEKLAWDRSKNWMKKYEDEF